MVTRFTLCELWMGKDFGVIMITIKPCKLADKDHIESLRQYAHTYHIKGNVICVAGAWATLPIGIQMGLIAHEVGHLLAGHVEHAEEEADRLANKFFGITIRYRNSSYGKNLQYLSDKDTNIVYGWVLDNISVPESLTV